MGFTEDHMMYNNLATHELALLSPLITGHRIDINTFMSWIRVWSMLYEWR